MKHLIRLLAVSFVASMLVGCGGGTTDTAAPPISVPNDGGDGAGAQNKAKAPQVPYPPKK